MAPTKSSFTSLFYSWINSINKTEAKNFNVLRGIQVYCNVCCTELLCGKKNQVQQHIRSAKHLKALERSKLHQTTVDKPLPSHDFNSELCSVMLGANIPFEKLGNPGLKRFLEKYCNRPIPSATSMRKTYIDKCYSQVIEDIRSSLQESYIWMSIDETTDRCGRFVANIIVGNLDGNPTNPRLLMSRELSKADNSTITDLVGDALPYLWPGKLPSETKRRFLLFLSDAAPYMVKAGKNLKCTYPKLLHVTCVAHAMHRVAEAIRSKYADVNTLMGSVKAVFKKCPEGIPKYHAMYPNLSLPPEPVITRWGTWIDAVSFYALNFEAVKSVVEQLDGDSAECVRKAQRILKSATIRSEISSIASNYGFLPATITRLETRSPLLVDVVDTLNECQDQLDKVKTKDGMEFLEKFKTVLQKNPDLKTVFQIRNILKEEKVETDLDPAVIVAFKYAPLTSVEVERSFSLEKNILSDRRTRFLMENLEKSIVCHFNISVDPSL